MRRRGLHLAVGVALVVSLGSCAQTGSATSFELAEFSITGPDQLTADTASVQASNSGEFAHTLVITDEAGEVAAATDLIQPGETSNLAIELSAGLYSFTCRIVIEDGEGRLVDHYQAGMNTTVRVTG